MKKKITYSLLGIMALGVILVGYHFYAASQAEQQLQKALEEQSEIHDSFLVQYQSIDIAPFQAVITIRDLTVIFGNHIKRSRQLNLDMDYLDFLNIYLGGLPYGLEQLTQVQITATQPSYLNRGGREEVKLDTMHISYTGNLWDGLQTAVNTQSFSASQHMEVEGSGLRISLPNTIVGRITAEKMRYSGSIPEGEQSFWKRGEHQFEMDSLRWTPPKSFQNSYGFFIKGFGYAADSIPLQSVRHHVLPTPESDLLKVESVISSELALLSSTGFIKIRAPLGNSRFQDMTIRLTDFSDTFLQLLDNLERLFSVSLPKSDDGITVAVEGTISNPSVAH